MSHHGEHQMNRTLRGEKKKKQPNVISSFPITPSFFTLWRKKDQPWRKWNKEEFVWYVSYFSTAILSSIWKLYSLCPANISRNLSKTHSMCLGRRHTQSEQDGKAQCKVAWKTLFAEKQSTYPPHPGDTAWMEASKKILRRFLITLRV